MADLTMPSLGADMTQGKLLEWLVKPGDQVKRGDIVAVVDTDKAEIEIEAFHDGVVDELVVPEGERVPVGDVIARMRDGVAPAAVEPPAPVAPPPMAAEPPAPVAPPVAAEPPAPVAPPAAAEHHPRVSPLARRAAASLGVDLAGIQGTGPGGAVVREDVERAAAGRAPAPAPPAAPAPAAAAAPDRNAAMRRAIGSLMARSKREIPHYYLQTTIDFGAARARLDALNAERPAHERLVGAVLMMRAVALAAREAPAMNGFWEDDALRPAEHVHLGVAVSLRGGGVVAPAIHDADALTLDELMSALRDLVHRVRNGRLRNSEMRDPTITVTNLGDRGAELVHGVIYPPQVALVGFGRVVERPWARDGMVGVRPTVTATLAADHRASDGHAGSLFLAAIERRLEEAEAL